MESKQHKLVVAVTGASGAIYAKTLLDRLKGLDSQLSDCGLIFSETSKGVWNYELGDNDYENYPWRVYDPKDLYAPMSSGSAGYRTMIICPCTVGTMGRIAAGLANDLISRAADVMLKERGKLILVLRESPYSLIHINNMKTLTEAGAIIFPASPSFYSKPQSVEALVSTVTDRVLDIAGFDIKRYRWGEKNSEI
ncbi:MAG: UbiX family flavin prenyltransferase [Bacteroidota bacterium]